MTTCAGNSLGPHPSLLGGLRDSLALFRLDTCGGIALLSCCDFLYLTTTKIAATAAPETTARPPTTPPTIAPVLLVAVESDGGGEELVGRVDVLLDDCA
jgi:hypothetical protein